jgi:hypothetical protein
MNLPVFLENYKFSDLKKPFIKNIVLHKFILMDHVYAPIDDDYDLSDISPGNSVNSENVTIMQGREFNLPVSDGGVESGVQNNMFFFVPEEKSILKKIEEDITPLLI